MYNPVISLEYPFLDIMKNDPSNKEALLREVEQPEEVRDRRSGLADPGGHVLLGEREVPHHRAQRSLPGTAGCRRSQVPDQ